MKTKNKSKIIISEKKNYSVTSMGVAKENGFWGTWDSPIQSNKDY